MLRMKGKRETLPTALVVCAVCMKNEFEKVSSQGTFLQLSSESPFPLGSPAHFLISEITH